MSRYSNRRAFLKTSAMGIGLTAAHQWKPSHIFCKDDWNEDAFIAMPKVDAHFHIRKKDTSFFDSVINHNFQLVVIAVESTPLQIQYQYGHEIKKKYPERVQYVTSFTMHGWEEAGWVQQTLDHLNREFDQGAVGVKIWKNIGMMLQGEDGKALMVDDELFNPIWELLIERGKTLIAHLADPRDAWLPIEQMRKSSSKRRFSKGSEFYMYNHPVFPSNKAILKARDTVLSRYPKLKFIGAHLASLEWDIKLLAKWLQDHPNSVVDLAGRIHDLKLHGQDEVRSLMIQYQDQLCYGTDIVVLEQMKTEDLRKRCHNIWISDWKYFTMNKYFNPISDRDEKGLHLPEPVLQKIYYSNAKKFFPKLV